MHIRTARPPDIARIGELYEEAIAFQRHGGHPFWGARYLDVARSDIEAGNLHALLVDQEIAGIFSFCAASLLDEDIWRDEDPGQARYINRIIVGRQWKGQALFAPMAAWCARETARLGLRALRLDTWADNPALIGYYTRFGFAYRGERHSSNSAALPPQYRGLRLAIMEKPIASLGNDMDATV
jgi:ribosomal protein S18 acetylase RimI-like enzyme